MINFNKMVCFNSKIIKKVVDDSAFLNSSPTSVKIYHQFKVFVLLFIKKFVSKIKYLAKVMTNLDFFPVKIYNFKLLDIKSRKSNIFHLLKTKRPKLISC